MNKYLIGGLKGMMRRYLAMLMSKDVLYLFPQKVWRFTRMCLIGKTF